MKTGTKSLLFGVHQVFLHPVTVALAWIWLYRRLPTFREAVCIVVHDWGYFGKAFMDDEDGGRNPELGAKIAGALFGLAYHDLCLFHSRHYAKAAGREPSLLCWPDKLSLLFDPWWLYLPRALASGELAEYREMAINAGFITETSTNREWHTWIRGYFSKVGIERRANPLQTALAPEN